MIYGIISGVLIILFASMAAAITRRILCGLLATTIILLTFPLVTFTLGEGKPTWMDFYDTTEYELLSFTYTEGEAIYLWLKPPGIDAPIYRVLPWSAPTASKIQKGSDDAAQSGARLRIQLEGTPDGTVEALPAPVMAPPPKVL